MAIEIGPFCLDAPIGRGGMGEVWGGVHVTSGIRVALKVLTREGSRSMHYAEAFRTEVAAIARLHHSGIIGVLDYGLIHERAEDSSRGRLVAGSPYIAMELASLGSLAEHKRALGWRELRAILLTTLDALGHAHARGIIHRDLKPANILLGCGPKQSVKLTDFGLAHALHSDPDPTDTSTGESSAVSGWGTPNYMAPEQFWGAWREYGPWTDLYALGCMAFELATGSLPFMGQSKWELGRLHSLAELPRLHPRFDVPEPFEAWVARLLQKSPTDRFQRAADAALAILAMSHPISNAVIPLTPSLPPTALEDPQSSIVPSPDEAIAYLTQLSHDEHLEQLMVQDLRQSARLSGLYPSTTPESAPAPVPPSEPLPTQSSASRSLERVDSAMHEELFEAGRPPTHTSQDTVVPTRIHTPPMPITWRRRTTDAPEPSPLAGVGLGLFDMRQPPLIGRDAERDLLWEALRQVHTSSRPCAVLLRGPSGMGKSMIAQWLATRAHEVGAASIMRASHSPNLARFDGLGPMIARHLNTLGLGDRSRVQERIRSHIAARWGEDRELVEPLTEWLAPQQELHSFSVNNLGRHRSTYNSRHHALRVFLTRESDERPLIVLIDDVQWAPEALLFVQNMLTSRQRLQVAMPVLFLMTLREDALEPGSLEAVLVAQLNALSDCYICRVEPLDDPATHSLIRALLDLDPQLTHQITQRAHGVPLFAVQLLAELVASRKLIPSSDGFTLARGQQIELPDDIHALWQRRLRRALEDLHPEQFRCVALASALGLDVELSEWRDACQHLGVTPDEDLLDALDERELISRHELGWSFSHNLLRESIARDAAHDQHALHLAIAQMLAARAAKRDALDPERDARQAYHLIEAGHPQLAMAPLVRATSARLGRGALDEAAELLDRLDALFATLTEPSPREEATLHLMRASLLDMRGQPLQARTRALQARHTALQAHDSQLADEATLSAAFAALHCGATDQAEELLESLLVSTAGRPSHSLPAQRCALRAQIGIGRVAQQGGHLEPAQRAFEEALRLAQLIDAPPLDLATCLNGLGDIARRRGELERARLLTTASLDHALRLDHTLMMADCYNDLSALSRLEGKLHEAEAYAQRALRLYESVGSAQRLRVARNLGFIALAQGDFRQARERFEAIQTPLRESHDYGQLVMVLAGLLPCLAHDIDLSTLMRTIATCEHLLAETRRRDSDIVFACQLAATQLELAAAQLLQQGLSSPAALEPLRFQLTQLARRYAPLQTYRA